MVFGRGTVLSSDKAFVLMDWGQIEITENGEIVSDEAKTAFARYLNGIFPAYSQ